MPTHTLNLQMATELILSRPLSKPDFSSIADLSMYAKIDIEAIRYLSEYRYDFIILAITSLDLELAECLGGWHGSPDLIFEDLIQLEADCAKALCKGECGLGFKKLEYLSTETAIELAKSNENLDLHIPFLSVDIASILAQHKSYISMQLANEPTYEVAAEIAQHRGYGIFFYHLQKHPSKTLILGLSQNKDKWLSIKKHPYPGDFYYMELMTKDL